MFDPNPTALGAGARDPRSRRPGPLAVIIGLLTAASILPTSAADDDLYSFNDLPRAELLTHPDWFNVPFLDLPEDQAAAVAAGKDLVVYFGQRRCAYCHKLMAVNFALADIAEYTRRHFTVTPIDIWGVDEVTTLDGTVMTERRFAQQAGATFTPSLIFYDETGHEALRLQGYYPPYQFRAALEYVADDHYRRESFREYLARGDNRMVFGPADLNDEPFFDPPPHHLDRSRIPSGRPLVVFFEQGDCHACDVLHGEALKRAALRAALAELDSVQLDMWSETPVVTPAGRRTTARQWAADLGLFYAPSLLFFNEQGEEILRVSSVAAFYRLRNVLSYISSKAYVEEPDYQRWRIGRAM